MFEKLTKPAKLSCKPFNCACTALSILLALVTEDSLLSSSIWIFICSNSRTKHDCSRNKKDFQPRPPPNKKGPTISAPMKNINLHFQSQIYES